MKQLFPQRCVLNKDGLYELIRSRRKTLSVTVREGKVTVRAPYGVSEKQIEKFLFDKRGWIAEKLSLHEKSVSRFGRVRNYGVVLDAGREVPAAFGCPRNAESQDGFVFKTVQSVRSYFIRTRGWILTETVHDFARKIGLTPENVKLCDSKAKWGSCDAARVIKLNWRLLMLPVELRDYVVVHELCHLKEMNHSPAFWRAVAKYCPDYRRLRAELKAYSFLTLLYRK